MPGKDDNFIRRHENLVETAPIPDTIQELISGPPALQDHAYKRGRPKKHLVGDPAKMERELEKQRAYYLEHAYQVFLNSMLHTVPAICKENCEFEASCDEILTEDQRPRSMPEGHPRSGKRCPIEYDVLLAAFHGYCTQLGIDASEPTEVQTAAKLAQLQVWERRIDCVINAGGMIYERIMGSDPQSGQLFTDWAEHPLFKIKDRMDERELKIIRQFNATREQKEKMKLAMMGKTQKSLDEWLSDLDEDDVIDVEAE